jgi:hypothetical protein
LRAASIANVAITAAFTLSDHRVQVYYDLIKAALSESAREALEMIFQNYQYQDEGLRRAKAEGELGATIAGLIDVLEARGFALGTSQRTRITECTSIEQLRKWHRAAVSAASVDDALRV